MSEERSPRTAVFSVKFRNAGSWGVEGPGDFLWSSSLWDQRAAEKLADQLERAYALGVEAVVKVAEAHRAGGGDSCAESPLPPACPRCCASRIAAGTARPGPPCPSCARYPADLPESAGPDLARAVEDVLTEVGQRYLRKRADLEIGPCFQEDREWNRYAGALEAISVIRGALQRALTAELGSPHSRPGTAPEPAAAPAGEPARSPTFGARLRRPSAGQEEPAAYAQRIASFLRLSRRYPRSADFVAAAERELSHLQDALALIAGQIDIDAAVQARPVLQLLLKLELAARRMNPAGRNALDDVDCCPDCDAIAGEAHEGDCELTAMIRSLKEEPSRG